MSVVYATPEWRLAVRLLIGDMAEPQLLTDQDLNLIHSMEGDNTKRAAAQALDIIASSEALVSKKINTQDVGTDGPAVANSLRDHADRLRAQADKADADAEPDTSFFEIIPFGTMPGPEGAEMRW